MFNVVPTVQTSTRSGGPRSSKYKALLAAAIELEVGFSIVVSPEQLGIECDGSEEALGKIRTNVASAVASHITRKNMGVRIRTSIDTDGNVVLSRFPELAKGDAAPAEAPQETAPAETDTDGEDEDDEFDI